MSTNKTMQWWLGRLLLLGGLTAYFVGARLYSGFDLGTEWVDADVGQRAAQAMRLLQGDLPYRDFWAHYPPLPYYTNALLFHLFQPRLSAFRLGLALVGIATAFLAYVITRRTASRLTAIAACLFTASWSVVDLNVNYNTWYCVPLAMATLWALTVAVQTRARWPWLLAGCTAGLVLGFKVNYGIVTILAVGLVAIADSGTQELAWRKGVRWILLALAGISGFALTAGSYSASGIAHFALPMAACGVFAWRIGRTQDAGDARWLGDLFRVCIGIAIVFVPWIVYFAMQWSAGAFLRTVFVDFVKYGESVTLPPAFPTLRVVVFFGLLGIAAWSAARARIAWAAGIGVCAVGVLAVPGSASGASFVESALYALVKHWVQARSFLPLVGIAAAVVVLFKQATWSLEHRALYVMTAGTSAVLLTYYPYSDVNHLQWTWPPVAVLTCMLLDRISSTKFPVMLCMVLAFSCVQLFQFGTHFYRPDEETHAWSRRQLVLAAPPRGDVYVSQERAGVISEAVAALQRLPEDVPVLELYGHFLGFLADRRNPTRYDYFWPGWLTNDEQQTLIEVLRNDPPAVVVGHKQSPDDEPLERFRAAFPVLGEYLSERYRPAQAFGPYQFYAARPAAAREAEMASSSGPSHSSGVFTDPNATPGLASP